MHANLDSQIATYPSASTTTPPNASLAPSSRREPRPRLPVAPLDRRIRRVDHAVRLRAVLLPEGLGQLGGVLLLEARRRTLRKRRQADALGLRRAVGPRHRLSEVLLVVVLRVVEDTTVGVIVGRGSALSRDRPAERLLVRRLAREDELLLLVVEPVEARAVLSADVVALRHAARRVVRLPEPTQNVRERRLLGVIHDLHRLGVAAAPAARLLVRRVGREASGVADRGRVDAIAGQAPDALLAAPEAAIGEDRDLVALRPRTLHLVAEHVVTVSDLHLLRAARQSVLGRDHLRLRHESEERADHAHAGGAAAQSRRADGRTRGAARQEGCARREEREHRERGV